MTASRAEYSASSESSALCTPAGGVAPAEAWVVLVDMAAIIAAPRFSGNAGEPPGNGSVSSRYGTARKQAGLWGTGAELTAGRSQFGPTEPTTGRGPGIGETRAGCYAPDLRDRGSGRSEAPHVLDTAQRRRLTAAANHLKVALAVSEDGPSDTAVAQVRSALTREPLLKVRVQTDDRAAADRVAAALAERVPCDLVRRTGFVLLLSRSATPARAEE